MPKEKPTQAERFQSSEEIRLLQRDKDRRWRKLARSDLKALAADSEGMDLLAQAIQAILRQDAPQKSTTKKRKHRR